MALSAAEEAQTRELIAQEAALLSLASSEPTIISKLGATKVNLSQLPTAASAADADLLLIRQGSTDKSIAGSAVKSYVKPADATETVSGVVELATTAEVQTGTDTTRAVTPAGRRSDTATSASDPTYADDSTKSASTQWLKFGFVISLATNGYIKFPAWLGGIVIEWGINSTAVAVDTNITLTFPLAFPTGALTISAIDLASVANKSVVWAVDILTPTNAKLHWSAGASGVGGANTRVFYWIAIGY